jgi:predicted amidophosphoribosyltransferase
MRSARKPRRSRHKPSSSVGNVLELLLPQRCLVCGAGGKPLCAACRARLPPLTPPLCARCGAPTAWPVARCRECAGRRLAFASARAALRYDEDVRRLVRAWKEQGQRGLAEDAAALVADVVARPAAVLVTFVPADPGRRLRRGYHPAQRLAEALARRWQLPCEPRLQRSGPSRRQRGLSLAERRRNVRDAFRSAPVRGSIVLVDDVYTSGATAHAAASALRAAGGARIEVVTFARAIRFSH